MTAPWLGGTGGSERALHDALAALHDKQVELVVAEQLGGPLASVPPLTHVQPWGVWHYRGSSTATGLKGVAARGLLNPLRKRTTRSFDLHLAYRGGPDITSVTRAGIRLFVPCGNRVTWTPGSYGTWTPGTYDAVAMEAPDNHRLVPLNVPSVLLPPALLPLADQAESLPKLPKEFFLTVFNPGSAIKGAQDLSAAVDGAPLPIVWCHSIRTKQFTIAPGLLQHRNIVHVDDPSPSRLRFLYEHCAAYLSFSRREGFGWAIADALQYSRALVSRPIGVLSFAELHQSGVHLIGDPWEFDWSLLDPATGDSMKRDLRVLSPEAFRDRIFALIDTIGDSTRSESKLRSILKVAGIAKSNVARR